MKTKKRIGLFFIFCLLFFAFQATASDFTPKGPLALRNQNPIYLEFLNLEPTRAKALPKGDFLFRIDNAYSNIFERGLSSNVDLLLHMELLRTALHFNAGIYENMEAGIEIPFLMFHGGFLDGFLQKYHHFFGFPNAGRENFPNGQFTYRFSADGVPLYEVSEQTFNLGDISINFKHNFLEEGSLSPAVAWLFYFKFPTGSRENGLGSGGPDFGFGAALEKSYNRWHGYLNLGYFVNGGQANLQDYIYNEYFSYMIGGELSVSRPVSVVAQITGGTPLLKNGGCSQWDSFPLDLQIGAKGEHHLGHLKNSNYAFIWQGGFSEDLNPNGPSVDLTIFGSIGIKFGK